MPYDRVRNMPPLDFPPQAGEASAQADDGPRLDFDYYVPFGLTAIANKIARSASRVYLTLFGVGINEWRILANLRVRPGMTANIICQTSGLDKAAVSRSLRLLETHDYIQIDKGAGDARGRNLTLTPKGRALHDKLIEEALARESRLLHGFSEDERRLLLQFIERMHRNVTLVNGAGDED